MGPKKQGKQQQSAQKKLKSTASTVAGSTPGPSSPTTAVKINYDELQSNEVMALQAIYGDDFTEHKGTHSAWKKSEPTFDIHIRASSDDSLALTLGVVLVATYPKSPPLLTIKSPANLKDTTLFKIQKLVETQPALLVKEEQEMIYSIIEGVQEILNEAAEAKAAGKALPTLEEERAAHEAAMTKMAEEQKKREDNKKIEDAQEEERMLNQMLQDEIKRKHDKEKEARTKSRPLTVSFTKAVSETDQAGAETIVFDEPCSFTETSGRVLAFSGVNGKEEFHRGPTTVVYEVRPILPAGQKRPRLALKHVAVHSSGKDQVQLRKQLQALEAQLEAVKKIRRNAILEVLDYRIDRTAQISDNGNVMSWNILVLTPLAEPGSLESLLRTFPMDHGRARSWTVSLLDTIGWLHSQGLVHQDIHLDNILLATDSNGDLVPKLADVAYQRELHNLTTAKTATSMTDARSAYWFPPEIAAASAPQYTQKTDIWDFGIVFIQLFLGPDVTRRFSSPDNLMTDLPLSRPFEEMVMRFFKAEWKKRPRAFELGSSEFLATDAPILFEDNMLLDGEEHVAARTGESRLSMPQFTPRTGRRESITKASRFKEDYVEEGRLGKGAFGEVVRARKKLDGQVYAVKKITLGSEEDMNEVLKEVHLLSQLSHPAVVRYFNTWLEKQDATEAVEVDNSSDGYEVGQFSQDFGSDYIEDDPSDQGGHDHLSNSYRMPDEDETTEGDDTSVHGDLGFEFAVDSDEDQDNVEGDNNKEGEEEDEPEEYEEDDDDDDDDGEDDTDEVSANLRLPRPKALPERKRERRLSHRPIKSTLYISMEYCEKQTLRDLITGNLCKDMEEVWRLFRQILQGLAHIHSLNVVHRDLKPDNVFISVGPDGLNNVKIGDFGLASKGQVLADKPHTSGTYQGGDMTRSIGTAVYVAPEVRTGGRGNYTSKVDMYSLGIMFFEMCSPVMLGMERAMKLEKLRDAHPTLPQDFKAGARQADIILSLVTHNPKERPSSAALLRSDKLPDEMESDTVRRALAQITDPESSFYPKTLSILTSIKLDPAQDFAFDLTDQSPTAKQVLHERLAKETLVSIFRTHGALEVTSSLVYPCQSYHAAAYKVLDEDGNLLQLPFDPMVGLSRMLATAKNPILGPSYAFSPVFRKKTGGGHPTQFEVADFRIVTAHALDLSLNEAFVMKVTDQIVHTFASIPSSQMAFHLSHSDLLHIIFDFCGIDVPLRRAAADVLSNLYVVGGDPWTKIRVDLRKAGLSATSINELGGFELRGSPVQIFAELKKKLVTTDHYQKAASAIAHINEVYQYCRSLDIRTRILIVPLHSHSEVCFRGGMMFSCVYDKAKKVAFAAGGRFDNLISEHRRKAGHSSASSRHAVGVSLNTSILQPQTRVSSKPSSKKAAAKRGLNLSAEKPYDVLVASFDPNIRKSTALEVLRELWDNGISATLANDARSPDQLIPDEPEEQPSWMVIVKSDTVKVKSLWTKDTPETDVRVADLSNWLRADMRERDSIVKTNGLDKTRSGTGQSEASSSIAARDNGNFTNPYGNTQQEVRVLTAQTKSKKTNRHQIVEQAQASVPKLLQEMNKGPIAVIQSTDAVLNAIKGTKLSEPDTWRKLNVSHGEKQYIKELQGMLTEYRDGGADHAFVYNQSTNYCVYYDLTK